MRSPTPALACLTPPFAVFVEIRPDKGCTRAKARGRTGAHGVGIAAAAEEREERNADELSEHAVGRDVPCNERRASQVLNYFTTPDVPRQRRELGPLRASMMRTRVPTAPATCANQHRLRALSLSNNLKPQYRLFPAGRHDGLEPAAGRVPPERLLPSIFPAILCSAGFLFQQQRMHTTNRRGSMRLAQHFRTGAHQGSPWPGPSAR